MNSNTQNPLFYILKSDPGRYINTPSATIVTLIRVAEAVISMLLFPKVCGYLLGLPGGSSPGVFALPGLLQSGRQTELLPPALKTLVEEQLSDIMPEGESLDSLLQDTLQNTVGDTEAGLQMLMTMGALETIVTGIAAAALLAVLAAVIAEAPALVFLRFAMQGSKVAKIAHKVIFIATLVMLLAGICLTVQFILKCRMLGVMMGALLAGQLRPVFIWVALCLVLLLLRVLYHRDVAKVLAAIDYEIQLEFKETTLKAQRLAGTSLIFTALALAGAVMLAFKAGPLSIGVIAMVVLMIKYMMVYTCWGNFHRCHM